MYYVYLLRDELLSDSFLLLLAVEPDELLLLLLLLLLEEELALLACCLDVVDLTVFFAGSDLFTGSDFDTAAVDFLATGVLRAEVVLVLVLSDTVVVEVLVTGLF